MNSIKKIIKNIKQPISGFLPIQDFEKIILEDDLIMNENENIPLDVTKVIVKNLTKFLISNDLKESFRFCIVCAMENNELDNINLLLNEITSLNQKSIISAFNITKQYYPYIRDNKEIQKELIGVEISKETIDNIIIMITRSIVFIKQFGPILKQHVTFEGGYSDKLTDGFCDFMTDGTLWKFKIIKEDFEIEDSLYLLICYVMSLNSNYSDLKNIYKIGSFNPRLKSIYLYDTRNIKQELIDEIKKHIY